jgi:hypothetical protein
MGKDKKEINERKEKKLQGRWKEINKCTRIIVQISFQM